MPKHVVYHGGHCCGIRHIYGFEYMPESAVAALSKYVVKFDSQGNVIGSMQFFADEAPAETALERFKRLVDNWKKRTPKGILEAVLADNSRYTDIGMQQSSHWRKHLEKANFKEISCCLNSNSSNRITVFHLCKDEKTIKERTSYLYTV